MQILNRKLSAMLLGGILCAAAWPVAAQRAFESPDAAAKALVAAASADDEAALVDIVGPQYRGVVVTNDKAQDREAHAKFVQAAKQYQLLRPEKDGRVTMLVGVNAWPLPIPLVQSGGSWRFDSAAGAEEIINRRIGANELAAIDVLHHYDDAQRRYAAKPRDGSNVRQFAQRLASTPGRKNGLYWDADAAKGEEASPVGPLLQDAIGGRERGDPFEGYYYRVLTAQGPAAPGGRYSYIINGRMLAGFALIAWPAQYGVSGVKTFIVNHYGDVYEKDFGAGTGKSAPAIREYNPDKTWAAVAD